MLVLWQTGAPGGQLPISAKRGGLSVRLGVLASPSAHKVRSPDLSRLLVPASVMCGKTVLPLQALIDSGAEDNLIDLEVVTLLGCQLEELDRPIPALALDGNMFTQITHPTSLVTLTVSGNHHEQITLKVISVPRTPLVLGHPWLMLHNPHIDWSTGSIKGWSLHCHSLCLHSARPPCVTDL